MPLPFPLLSDWCLEFESPQMWHRLTFGIWVIATAEMTGDVAQPEKRYSMDKAFLTCSPWLLQVGVGRITTFSEQQAFLPGK